jgi:hypothetical protein
MRDIVESIEVMAEVDEASRRWARLDDAWSALHWALSRDPTLGEPLFEGGHIRSFVYVGSYSHEMPTIDVVYEVTQTQVVIQRVRFREASTSAGHA